MRWPLETTHGIEYYIPQFTQTTTNSGVQVVGQIAAYEHKYMYVGVGSIKDTLHYNDHIVNNCSLYLRRIQKLYHS